jgi:formyltetrahydrofolate-dependent phosphoribosylglycinamide formyltransferase
MSEPFRVAVLASGSGSNFQAILDTLHHQPESPVKVVTLVASRPGIRAIDRATSAGVPSVVLPAPTKGREAAADRLGEALAEARADLIVLAGYLRLIPEEIVRAHWGRMINIHPALLPAFGGEGMYGGRVHEAVIDRGARISGVTVHFVDEAYDRGPIIGQWPVPVFEADTPEALAARVLRVEHVILPAVVNAIARGHVELAPSGRCVWSRPWFGGDRFVVAPNVDPESPADSDEAGTRASDGLQPSEE